MRLFHLYFFNKIKPLWLQKIIANLLGFVIVYPIALHNKESALLLSLFLAAYLYKNMQNLDYRSLNATESSDTDSSATTHSDFAVESGYANTSKSLMPHDLAIIQLMMSCFCACLFVFTTWQIYILEAMLGCIFIRIYDYYKPSLIGRLYNLEPNKILGSILGAILHSFLSGTSVMILYYVSIKLS